MQLRQHGQPIASAQVGWAKQYSDGAESWVQSVRMQIASCSKLITAIAMTRTLAAQGYRLESVSGYSTGGRDRIAAIWTK
jgi:hypothetical protein